MQEGPESSLRLNTQSLGDKGFLFLLGLWVNQEYIDLGLLAAVVPTGGESLFKDEAKKRQEMVGERETETCDSQIQPCLASDSPCWTFQVCEAICS